MFEYHWIQGIYNPNNTARKPNKKYVLQNKGDGNLNQSISDKTLLMYYVKKPCSCVITCN